MRENEGKWCSKVHLKLPNPAREKKKKKKKVGKTARRKSGVWQRMRAKIHHVGVHVVLVVVHEVVEELGVAQQVLLRGAPVVVHLLAAVGVFHLQESERERKRRRSQVQKGTKQGF